MKNEDLTPNPPETHRTVYTSRLAKDGGRRIANTSLERLGRVRAHGV